MNNDYPFPDQCEKCIHNNVCYMVGECVNYIPGFECDCFEEKQTGGEWIPDDELTFDPARPWWKCSKCGERTGIRTKYCPECGKRNRRTEE